MASDLDFKIELSPHLTLTEMEGKWVLFSKQSGDFYGLNESAGILLKLLLEHGFKHCLPLAKQHFDTPEEILQHDLLELVEDLELQKLIKRV